MIDSVHSEKSVI